MTPPMDEAMVKVTQADREIASEALEILTGQHLSPAVIRQGNCDDFWIVQAFSRHRLAAIEASGAHELAGALDRVRELVDQEISAWAFANDIDGALRNDLMCRVRAALKRHRGEP